MVVGVVDVPFPKDPPLGVTPMPKPEKPKPGTHNQASTDQNNVTYNDTVLPASSARTEIISARKHIKYIHLCVCVFFFSGVFPPLPSSPPKWGFGPFGFPCQPRLKKLGKKDDVPVPCQEAETMRKEEDSGACNVALRLRALFPVLGPPVVPCTLLWGEDSPTKIDYRKKRVPLF